MVYQAKIAYSPLGDDIGALVHPSNSESVQRSNVHCWCRACSSFSDPWNIPLPCHSKA